MTRQFMHIAPRTLSGKWSIGLIVAMPILFIVGGSLTNSLYVSIPSGDTILADIAARPVLALTMLAGMAAGVSAFVTGLWAISRKNERSLLVFVSTALGALFLLYLAGELIYPH